MPTGPRAVGVKVARLVALVSVVPVDLGVERGELGGGAGVEYHLFKTPELVVEAVVSLRARSARSQSLVASWPGDVQATPHHRAVTLIHSHGA